VRLSTSTELGDDGGLTSAGEWSKYEIDALSDCYLEMLRLELSGQPYVKRQFNLALQQRIERSHSSIEFKLCNLSAVLRDLSRPYINGYKPRSHYQASLREVVEARLEEFPQHLPDAIDPPSPDGPEFWSHVQRLWDRSTGGGDVAAKPGPSTVEDALPTAPRPPGVDEACRWFANGVADSGLPRFLLLVGGPGAGKSHAASALVKPLVKESPPDDGLAHRRYIYSSGSSRITLINDATIPSDDHTIAPLCREIDETVAGGTHFIACVNRGILVEESSTLANTNSTDLTAGESVLKWITNESSASQDEQTWRVEAELRQDYVASGRLTHEGRPMAHLLVVFVDVCSLLERRPELKFQEESGDLLSAGKYQIADLSQRLDWDDASCPAGSLLAQVVDDLKVTTPDDGRLNPVVANVESLQSETIRSGFLAILRAAEIVNGKRFTYREIWGATVRGLVGALPESVERASVEAASTATLTADSDAIAYFRQLQILANHRFSQAIFGVEFSTNDTKSDPRRNPVTRLTSQVDPMRDAVPGKLTSDATSGWATPVTDAFTGPAVAGSPLQNLLERVPEDDSFRQVITSFDEGVDAAYSAAMNTEGLKDRDRYAFIHWYGTYLGRLYAVANGVMAFRRDVSLWAETWYSSPALPDDLRNGLRTLLRPKRRPQDNDSSSLIPILDSRTDPIVGMQAEAKLALLTGDVDMKSLTDAEEIFLILSEHGKEISRMPLDFQLVREATACGSDRPGLTELTESTSPRLERFRAARLVPFQLENANYRLVHGDRDSVMIISKG
jgi:hypothetical protein